MKFDDAPNVKYDDAYLARRDEWRKLREQFKLTELFLWQVALRNFGAQVAIAALLQAWDASIDLPYWVRHWCYGCGEEDYVCREMPCGSECDCS